MASDIDGFLATTREAAQRLISEAGDDDRGAYIVAALSDLCSLGLDYLGFTNDESEVMLREIAPKLSEYAQANP